jgi:hypothetical protein
MMVAVFLPFVDMHELQLVLSSLRIEVSVRINDVNQILIEGHNLGKLGLWHHKAIMSQFMHVAGSILESVEPSQARFPVGKIDLLILRSAQQLRRQLLPMNKAHSEADRVFQRHHTPATGSLIFYNPRHSTL